jgi:hypothetical protein
LLGAVARPVDLSIEVGRVRVERWNDAGVDRRFIAVFIVVIIVVIQGNRTVRRARAGIFAARMRIVIAARSERKREKKNEK